jgi:FkbM family methyltransferase
MTSRKHFVCRALNMALLPFGVRLEQTPAPCTLGDLCAMLPGIGFDGAIFWQPVYSDWMVRRQDRLRILSVHHELRFTAEKEGLRLRFDDLQFRIMGHDELLILHEVFHKREYSLELGNRPHVVADFGMNVGIASLFFARQSAVTAVYGYEPFGSTYNLALQNISMNPECGHKIIPHQFGLGRESSRMICKYNALNRGLMGNMADHSRHQWLKTFSTEEIEIRPASVEIQRIKNEHPSDLLILKCDVEGAEKEIVRDLSETDTWRLVNMVVMEWHYESPDLIVRQFTDMGYVVSVHGGETADTWNVTAIRCP